MKNIFLFPIVLIGLAFSSCGGETGENATDDINQMADSLSESSSDQKCCNMEGCENPDCKKKCDKKEDCKKSDCKKKCCGKKDGCKKKCCGKKDGCKKSDCQKKCDKKDGCKKDGCNKDEKCTSSCTDPEKCSERMKNDSTDNGTEGE